MKYLVNRETKEHKVATPLAESIIKRYPDFRDDWQLVEADSEGWIPWSGGECPLPDDCECNIKTKHMREHSMTRIAAGWDWAHDNYNAITAYRPFSPNKETANANIR